MAKPAVHAVLPTGTHNPLTDGTEQNKPSLYDENEDIEKWEHTMDGFVHNPFVS